MALCPCKGAAAELSSDSEQQIVQPLGSNWCRMPLVVCTILDLQFYRVMHFSAKRGLAIACRRPSVCLSVCDVDCDIYIGWICWKSWKLDAQSISAIGQAKPQKAIHLLPGEYGEILGRLEVGI